MSEAIEATEDTQPKATKKRMRYNVSAEDFVITWETSQSAQEVADKLQMPKSNVLARASNYRSRGVQLKRMKRATSRRLNVEQLNTLSTPKEDAA